MTTFWCAKCKLHFRDFLTYKKHALFHFRYGFSVMCFICEKNITKRKGLIHHFNFKHSEYVEQRTYVTKVEATIQPEIQDMQVESVELHEQVDAESQLLRIISMCITKFNMSFEATKFVCSEMMAFASSVSQQKDANWLGKLQKFLKSNYLIDKSME